jgi:hypothetical protein
LIPASETGGANTFLFDDPTAPQGFFQGAACSRFPATESDLAPGLIFSISGALN